VRRVIALLGTNLPRSSRVIAKPSADPRHPTPRLGECIEPRTTAEYSRDPGLANAERMVILNVLSIVEDPGW